MSGIRNLNVWTPSPSIISGDRVWAYDLLDWLDREGWKLVQK